MWQGVTLTKNSLVSTLPHDDSGHRVAGTAPPGSAGVSTPARLVASDGFVLCLAGVPYGWRAQRGIQRHLARRIGDSRHGYHRGLPFQAGRQAVGHGALRRRRARLARDVICPQLSRRSGDLVGKRRNADWAHGHLGAGSLRCKSSPNPGKRLWRVLRHFEHVHRHLRQHRPQWRLDVYVETGIVGVAMLLGLSRAAFSSIRLALVEQFDLGAIALATLLANILSNFTESLFLKSVLLRLGHVGVAVSTFSPRPDIGRCGRTRRRRSSTRFSDRRTNPDGSRTSVARDAGEYNPNSRSLGKDARNEDSARDRH